ncbi:MAG: hypothetical protein JWM80_3539 [Cyanobacteria bacterium RYN_339]|nr:hypothetical protein [Cyanobacteria bacterium RYN_339]
MQRTFGQWLFLAVVMASAACGELTQGVVGYSPGGDAAPATAWTPVPGALAYQVIVSLDRSGMEPVGTTAFGTVTQLDTTKIAWHEGHPIRDRPYFWVVRAFDRPDPQGVLLSVTEPREIQFTGQPGGVTFTYSEPSPSPSPVPSATMAPSPLTGPS